jgi:hypothetical protein
VKKLLVLCGLMFTTVAQVHASELEEEISPLLLFVKNTECKYDRNGTIHNGEEAVEHIQKKYNYFKNRITSTERFIELSATQSTLSGRLYTVQCAGSEKITSKDWLLNELESYRARNATTLMQ